MLRKICRFNKFYLQLYFSGETSFAFNYKTPKQLLSGRKSRRASSFNGRTEDSRDVLDSEGELFAERATEVHGRMLPNDRCLKNGMGCRIKDRRESGLCSRRLVSGSSSACKHFRIGSSTSRSGSFQQSSQRQKGADFLGQQDDCGHSSKNGVLSLPSSPRYHAKNSLDFISRSDGLPGLLYSREREHNSGQSFQVPFSWDFWFSHYESRINAIKQQLLSNNGRIESCARSRPFCFKQKSSSTCVCKCGERHKSVCSECVFYKMDQMEVPVRISSSSPDRKDSTQVGKGEGERCEDGSDCSILAESVVVGDTSSKSCAIMSSTPVEPRFISSVHKRDGSCLVSKISSDRISTLTNNLPLDCDLAKFVSSYTSKSTEKQYQYKWKKFYDILTTNRIAVVDINVICFFFKKLFDSKICVQNVLNFRSALTEPIRFLTGLDLASNDLLSLMIRKLKCQRKKVTLDHPTWDIDKVLKYLSSPEFKTLMREDVLWFFKKTFFLVLLAIPSRISEFQCISISESSFSDVENIVLRPSVNFISKNNTHTFAPTHLKLHMLENDEFFSISFSSIFRKD